ncbi:MAG: hypothetical protein HY553_21670 [Elusimicrobia bacterium]|nr:hypothetical protein [Elusimicrobiota bacterium]
MAPPDLNQLLLEQARATVDEFRAIERHFQDPRGKSAAEAAKRAESAAEAAARLEQSLEDVPAPRGRRKELFLISRSLGRFATAGRALALEAARYGVSEDPQLAEMAHSARRAAEEIAEAVERLGGASAEALPNAGAAARAAGRAEHVRREATRATGAEPNAVVAIKLRGLHRRFSEAAEHAAEAAELLGEVLGR